MHCTVRFAPYVTGSVFMPVLRIYGGCAGGEGMCKKLKKTEFFGYTRFYFTENLLLERN